MSWLGFRNKPDFTKAKWLGHFLGILTIILALCTVILSITFFILLFKSVFISLSSNNIPSEDVRNIGLVLIAVVSAPFLIWRTMSLAKQVEIADSVHFNEKVSHAVRDLTARFEITRIVIQDEKEIVLKEWQDDLVTRVSAIDQLETLIYERNTEAPRIVRLVANYIRGNFRAENLNFTEPPFKSKIPRMDLQKAIDMLGRTRSIAAEIDTSNWRLDLTKCNFDGVNFQGGDFYAADFRESRFEASNMKNAIFEGCNFSGSLLNFAQFHRSNLKGIRFHKVTLNRSDYRTSRFSWVGTIIGASFINADLSAIDYFGKPSHIANTFGTKDTLLSQRVHNKMPTSEEIEDYSLLVDSGSFEGQEIINLSIKKVERSGFQNWSPYDSDDLVTEGLFADFLKKLDMYDWPYID